jgi:hypothetical protein
MGVGLGTSPLLHISGNPYLCRMRTLANLVVATLLWVGLGLAHDGQSSKMVLKVEKDQVEVAQKALASLKGVQKVSYDEGSGHLVIFYDKPTLGCCSRIHSALQSAGVKYVLVSNEEVPACKDKDHSHEHSEAATPATPVKHKSKKKGCCKEGSKAGCAKGA